MSLFRTLKRLMSTFRISYFPHCIYHGSQRALRKAQYNGGTVLLYNCSRCCPRSSITSCPGLQGLQRLLSVGLPPRQSRRIPPDYSAITLPYQEITLPYRRIRQGYCVSGGITRYARGRRVPGRVRRQASRRRGRTRHRRGARCR